MRRAPLLLLLFAFVINVNAQRIDKKLTRAIEKTIQGFNGNVGVYIKDLIPERIVAINADTLFPTASLIKVPLLIGVMDKINKGELSYHQELVYKDSLLYEGVDLLGSFKDGEKIELSKVLMLMLTMSDNTASLWLQSLAGGGSRINTIIDSLEFEATRVNSRTVGRERSRGEFGWGQTSPKEMASLLKIYKRQIISTAASDRMLRLLSRNYWDTESISQIPPYVAVFSKNGAVDKSRSEVVLVKGRKSAYVFCIATKNNKDESWEPTNEAWILIRKISRTLYDYFEPKDNWQPDKEAKRFN